MNSNSEENKDHVELTEKSAQQWLKIRRYTTGAPRATYLSRN
jgi:hypothetical protein